MSDDSIPRSELDAAQAKQERRRRYERWMDRSILAGMVVLFGSMLLWAIFDSDPVLWAGSLALPAGYLAYIAIEYASPMQVRDERTIRVEYEAGRIAIYVVGFVLAALAPLTTAAEVTGDIDVPGAVWGVVNAYVGLFVLIGLASWWIDRRHTEA